MTMAIPPKAVSAIVLHPDDTVATLLGHAKAGDYITLGPDQSIIAAEDVPIYFKISLEKHSLDGKVIKYGQTIGTATAIIQKGAKVHIHNMTSTRGRLS